MSEKKRREGKKRKQGEKKEGKNTFPTKIQVKIKV